VLLEWALQQHRRKDFAGALKTYRTYLKMQPDYAPVFGLAAECAIRTDDITEALALWQKSERAGKGTLERFESLVCDVNGGILNAKGLDTWKLNEHVARTGSVRGFAESEPVSNEDLLTLKCDVLVPAALERQITAANAGKIQCRILAEAANGPTTPDADVILNGRPEIFVIPDILCNAGGVVVSYFEWVQDLQSFFWSETEVLDKLYRILEGAFIQVLTMSRKEKISMRSAALTLGIKRVLDAKKLRGLYP
jgi:glutamate dehydrogenase (NAD(P)+)